MKNLSGLLAFVLLALVLGLACKNPFTGMTKKYNCTIAGEPEPRTSEEYVSRARKHAELYSGDELATKFDDCAFDALNEALRLDPNNARALVLRGRAFSQRRDDDSALSDLEKAIQIEPNNADAYNFRSAIYAEKGSYDKAVEDMTRVIEFSAKDDRGRSHFYAARAFYNWQKGDLENAASDYTEAIRLKPDNKFSYSSRAEVYRKLGKNDLAEADNRKILEMELDENPPQGVSQMSNSNQSTSSRTISGGVLNGKATDLPKPAYPAAAKAVKASGAVNVQVTVDEKGSVVAASAVSGHPLLRAAATQAARQAKFSPTLLSGKPVKVTGIIVYNFVPD